jgi:pSer/pThr/pTyr-binding forkhead associated (FHA) protein
MSYQDFDENEVESTQRFGGDLLPDDESGLNSEEHTAINALPSGHALLIVKRGYEEGSRFLLDSDVATAGRHPNADIFLDDVTVSRKHAEFVRNGKTFSVKDLASLNGTYHNGKRVEEIALTDGDEVQVGKFKLTFFAAKADK